MTIETILEFFYKKTSERIKKEVEKSNLTYREIYMRDSKQIGYIINNKRTKNNRYLIPDAVLKNTDDFGNADGLLAKLSFSDCKEILWGTDNEIDNYLPELFELLWEFTSYKKNPYNIDKEMYLCDYIPYAKLSTYLSILEQPDNIYPALFYGIREDTIYSNIALAEKNAYKYLYNNCKDSFSTIFHEFAKNTDSYHCLNTVFKHSFIDNLFVPMLNKHKPTAASLGLRVQAFIRNDLRNCATLYFENNSSKNSYLFKLINASSTYICALEEIQSMEYDESLKM